MGKNYLLYCKSTPNSTNSFTENKLAITNDSSMRKGYHIFYQKSYSNFKACVLPRVKIYESKKEIEAYVVSSS